MAIDAKKILIGAPDQSSTTGAVNYAATTATLPTDATSALSDFTSCGYVSEDGVTLTPTFNTTNIKDWSRATVRTLLEEFTGEVTFGFIQTDYESLCAIFGSDHVTQSGDAIAIKMGAHMAPAKAFAFNMKDGDAKVRIVLPNAQAVIDGDITFVANQPINWGVKLTCGADEYGESIYIYVDGDGSTTTAGA